MSDLSSRGFSSDGQHQQVLLKLTGILESTTDFVSMATPDLRLTYLNKAGRAMVGWSDNADLSQKSIRDVHPPAAFDQIIDEGIPAAIRDGTHTCETLVLGADGRNIPVTQVIIVHKAADGTLESLSTIIRDISPLKAIQDDLNGKLMAIEASITAMAMADASGTLTYVNRAFLDLWGEPDKTMVLGRPAFSFWSDLEEAQHVAKVLHSDKYWRGDMQARRHDGSVFTALVSASAIESVVKSEPVLLATFVDISAWRQAEHLIRDQAEKFRVFLDTTLEGYWLVNASVQLIDVNTAACRMLGYTREEMLAKTIPDLEDMESAEETRQHVERLMARGYDRFETRHRRKDGSTLDVEVSTTYSRSGSEPLIFVFIQDISNRKRLEDMHRQAEVAKRANLAKSSFLSNISHELRTPLNAILGFSQLMAGDTSLNPAQLDYLHEISNAGTNLLNLINRILDLIKIESGTISLALETVDCCVVLHESLNMVQALAAEKGIFIEFQACSGLDVMVDRQRLKQVLINLLVNAVKFNKPGGSVFVAAEPHGTLIRLMVKDTGHGIPADRIGELFIPFNRPGKESVDIPGTGIGLAFSKQLIDMMGGSISLETVVDAGTTFWVNLPRVDSDNAW